MDSPAGGAYGGGPHRPACNGHLSLASLALYRRYTMDFWFLQQWLWRVRSPGLWRRVCHEFCRVEGEIGRVIWPGPEEGGYLDPGVG
jgi:hypothetical protein